MGFPGSTTSLADLLSRLEGRLAACGEELALTGIAVEVASLRERLTQGRFHLAVLGQFKRGKSTLINALLGDEVLPSSVVPLTAIPTFVSHGTQCGATVVFGDGRPNEDCSPATREELREYLSGYVTESGNPRNRHGVESVEVRYDAPILAKGLVLIDTPGIGSTFRHNTEATLNFLPQCDAALFLASADPPLTEVEIEFLSRVRETVPRVFFLLNKIDYLDGEEQAAALAFMRSLLKEKAGFDQDPAIFPVSARRGLQALRSGDDRAWKESGLERLRHHLVDFLAAEKSRTLRQAISLRAADLAGEALLRLRLALRSLKMPLEDLQARLASFEEKLEEVRRSRQITGDLLAGDQRRMHEFLEDLAAELRAAAREHLHSTAAGAEPSGEGTSGSVSRIEAALAEAIPVYFEHQTGVNSELLKKRVAEVLLPHQERADELIESIRRTAAELFEVPYHAPESDRAFRMVRRPYWVTNEWATSLTPVVPGMVDRVLPEPVRRKRFRARLDRQIDALAVRNVENLRWALYQSIDQTFNEFSSKLDARLEDTTSATLGAIRVAATRRDEQSEAVAREVERLKAAIRDLEALQAETTHTEPDPLRTVSGS